MTRENNQSLQATEKAGSRRLTDVDIAKGLAIFLVVFGHIVAQQPPADNEWYVLTKQALYKFHMGFFMFLSGIVFFYKTRGVGSWQEYRNQIWKRFIRLMPSYFLFAGIVFLAKLSTQHFLHVDNPIKGWTDILGILLYPMQSVSAFLWYIYVLFLFCAASLALLSLCGDKLLLLVAIGVGLIFAPKTPFLGMDQFCKYFLFFSLGGLAIRHWTRYCALVQWAWIPTSLLFALSLICSGFYGNDHTATFTGLLSLIALHGLCRQKIPFADVLRFLGLMSFPIYLMNTLSIGLTKAVMLKIISWDGLNFLIFAPILTAAGLGIPILIKQFIFRRIVWLDKITS